MALKVRSIADIGKGGSGTGSHSDRDTEEGGWEANAPTPIDRAARVNR